MLRDRLSWLRFLGFDLGAPTPDENTMRHYRNRLTETGTLGRVMKAFDWQLQKKGYIPMAGQIVDASLVPAPKERNTEDEKAAIKAGKSAGEIWPDEPNKAVQKDVDARTIANQTDAFAPDHRVADPVVKDDPARHQSGDLFEPDAAGRAFPDREVLFVFQ